MRIDEFDIFFLSYDEPNADANYADLMEKSPWAQRVHGVKGFEAAHRRCAELSQTDWFVGVDGDSRVRSEFFDLEVDLDPISRPLESISWNGVNHTNGLMYGNGGVKLWSKQFVLNGGVGHEATDDPKHAVDFCWQENYRTEQVVMSDVYSSASPKQAFRSGFREGIKLILNGGMRVPKTDFCRLPEANLRNIHIWSSVGRDRDNGLWGILGARMGVNYMTDPDFDHRIINDYDGFDDMWGEVKDRCENNLLREIHYLGQVIKKETGLYFPLLDDEASIFFREMMKLRNA